MRVGCRNILIIGLRLLQTAHSKFLEMEFFGQERELYDRSSVGLLLNFVKLDVLVRRLVCWSCDYHDCRNEFGLLVC